MKMSTAIALGSTMIRGIAGRYLNEDRSGGCALGMINMAMGNEKYLQMAALAQRKQVTLPCGCRGIIISSGMRQKWTSGSDSLPMAIMHLFNDHVMTRKDWSLEKLIDWVASVEPPDPEEAQEVKAEQAAEKEVFAWA